MDSRPCQCAPGSVWDSRARLAQPASMPSIHAQSINRAGRKNLTVLCEGDSWFQAACRLSGSVACHLSKPPPPLRAVLKSTVPHLNGRLFLCSPSLLMQFLKAASLRRCCPSETLATPSYPLSRGHWGGSPLPWLSVGVLLVDGCRGLQKRSPTRYRLESGRA